MFATETDAPAWLEQLNERQRQAATQPAGPVLVIAGAGTGKTTTLCARAAWLLCSGVPAERILLITFTRRAAREMVERSRTLAERAAPRRGRMVAGTFHAVAHRFVRMHAGALGLPDGFGVLDAGDASDLMGIVRVEQGGGSAARRFPRPQTMLEIYSRTVNAQVPLPGVLTESFPWCEEHVDALAQMFRSYVARKRELGVLDLDDLLLYWRALLRDELTGEHIAGLFDHVLVDEYQDVNELQVEIVKGLRRGGRTGVTAVGDDMQSIYGFRCGDPRHIRRFPDHFPGCTVVTLERNYRSTAPILAVANALSEQETGGYDRRLWSNREGGATPELAWPLDEADQARMVCERVLDAREQGMELRAQAVLFRAGHDSDLLELELTRRDVPFVKYGGLRYLEAAHVKDLLAALRLVSNPADEVSWMRLLQLIDGVGPVRARRIVEALRPAADRAPQLERWPRASAHVPEAAREHADALVAVLGGTEAMSCGELVEAVCEALEPLARVRYPDWQARAPDYERLLAAARGASDVRRFVSELVLDPPASSSDLAGPPHLDEDYLTLSTVHSAKGLEWDAIHVIAVYDGNFPADMSAGSAEGIAEERRLLYVALTRARRRLHVYVPTRYYHRPEGRGDAHGYGRASRFLTPAVRGGFAETGQERPQETLAPAGRAAAGRISVSVEELFP